MIQSAPACHVVGDTRMRPSEVRRRSCPTPAPRRSSLLVRRLIVAIEDDEAPPCALERIVDGHEQRSARLPPLRTGQPKRDPMRSSRPRWFAATSRTSADEPSDPDTGALRSHATARTAAVNRAGPRSLLVPKPKPNDSFSSRLWESPAPIAVVDTTQHDTPRWCRWPRRVSQPAVSTRGTPAHRRRFGSSRYATAPRSATPSRAGRRCPSRARRKRWS